MVEEGIDYLAEFKVPFDGGSGTKKDPYQLKPAVLITNALRDAAYLSVCREGGVFFNFNGNTFAVDRGLNVRPADPEKTDFLDTVIKASQELKDKEHLDELLKPVTPEELQKALPPKSNVSQKIAEVRKSLANLVSGRHRK